MSYSQLYAHFVWATWERAPLIAPEIEQDLWSAIAAQCHTLGARPIRVGGMPDHVHVLTAFPATLALSKLAAAMKGASSHLMSHVLMPGRAFRWQDGYGAFTLRKTDVPVVAAYVIKQKQHHSARAAIEEWEPIGRATGPITTAR
jgi:putative transposase